MDWSVRFTTGIVALFASLLIISLGLWWALGTQSPQLIDPPDADLVVNAGVGAQQQSYLRGPEALRAAAAIEDLQLQLERAERLVASKNQSLEQRRLEIMSLREKLRAADELNSLMIAVTQAAPMPNDGDTPRVGVLEEEGNPLGPGPSDGLQGELEATDDPGQAQEPEANQADSELLQQVRTQLADREAEMVLHRLARTEVIQAIGLPALDGLISALNNQKAEVRAWACEALGDLGLQAAEAYGPLRMLLNDSDPTVRERARVALSRVRE